MLKQIRNYLSTEASETIDSSYMYWKLLHSSLICVFESKANNIKINKTQKQALTTVYNDYENALEELLDIVARTTIHTKHLQFLITEVFKYLNHLDPEFI